VDESLFTTFAQVEEAHWWFLARREIVLAVAERFVPAGSPVLDLGCGTGFVLSGLKDRYRAFGLDLSPMAVELCRKRGLACVALGSTDDLSAVAARRFQAVFLLDVIEHLDDDLRALQRAACVLEPGGVVIITVPAFMFLWSPHDEVNEHRRRYTRKPLAELLTRAGFEVEQVSYANTNLFPLAVLRRLAARMLGQRSTVGIKVPARPINELFRRLFAAERSRLVRASGQGGVPFGVSLLAVGRKRD
jgi:SAM-dependent methyltransferase